MRRESNEAVQGMLAELLQRLDRHQGERGELLQVREHLAALRGTEERAKQAEEREQRLKEDLAKSRERTVRLAAELRQLRQELPRAQEIAAEERTRTEALTRVREEERWVEARRQEEKNRVIAQELRTWRRRLSDAGPARLPQARALFGDLFSGSDSSLFRAHFAPLVAALTDDAER